MLQEVFVLYFFIQGVARQPDVVHQEVSKPDPKAEKVRARATSSTIRAPIGDHSYLANDW